MGRAGRILVVDDDPLIRKSLVAFLERNDWSVSTAAHGADALARLDEDGEFDLVLSDVDMPRLDGLGLLERLRERKPDLPVIMITGCGTIENAVAAMRAGASHYVTKPLRDDEILHAIDREIERSSLLRERTVLRAENERLRRSLRKRFSVDDVIGRDAKMKQVFETAEMVADTRATVLITGESGTGKTLIARAIHYNSNRSDNPFVEVNCGALPETLLESELFGHAKGAFTGAHADRVGKFQLADTGTIFLDEIGNASSAFQVKLLRVLQDREFERIGQHETVQVDVRVVLATNKDLARAVQAGDFREDLYYRINVVSIELPPLRERRDDLDLLANHFLDKYVDENQKDVRGIDDEALAALRAYAWPGNVRELENVIERAVVLTREPVITKADLPRALLDGTADPEVVLPDPGESMLPLKDALAHPEKRIIERALRANKWNRQRTADVLQVNRTTLFNKMKKYGLLKD